MGGGVCGRRGESRQRARHRLVARGDHFGPNAGPEFGESFAVVLDDTGEITVVVELREEAATELPDQVSELAFGEGGQLLRVDGLRERQKGVCLGNSGVDDCAQELRFRREVLVQRAASRNQPHRGLDLSDAGGFEARIREQPRRSMNEPFTGRDGCPIGLACHNGGAYDWQSVDCQSRRSRLKIDVGGVRLYVDVDGKALVPRGPEMVERPTVLLLHGGPGMDHSYFKHGTTYDYTDVAQVIYYDHRGNGRSDRGAAEDWRLDVWADDLVRLCDALGIERPIVIGESFGGFVAQRYLARHPDHPSRVVLGCTSARLDIDIVAAAFGRRGGAAAESAARDFWTQGPELIFPYLEHCMPLYSVEPDEPDVLARQIMNLELMAHFQTGEQRTMDLAPGLAAATCPVLVLAGELDPVCPVEMSDEIVAALTSADVTYERVPGASHDDVGYRSARTIRSFITSST